MFTGLIEEVGTLKQIDKGQVDITCKTIMDDVKIGDSIACDGVCLTVTSFRSDGFKADIMPETRKRTIFSSARPRKHINLERALKVGDRFGGHMVSGHVDTTAKLKRQYRLSNAVIFEFQGLNTNRIIEQGSVAINGISLTVVSVRNNFFSVSIIPETLRSTNLGRLRSGDLVNIEYDQNVKVVERQGLTMDTLRRHGFA